MKIRRSQTRATASAERLVALLFSRHHDHVCQEAGPSLSDVVEECKRHNPGLEAAEVYEAIEACGPSDEEVQDFDRRQSHAQH